MAAKEDQEVFEITDYTTASDWERFTASIEEVVHEWKLNKMPKKCLVSKVDFSEGKWKSLSETISFSGFRFVIVYHYLDLDNVNDENEPASDIIDEDTPQSLKDMANLDIDFATTSDNLSYWYGIREYIVLSPANGENAIANESRANLLLSSISVALFNTACQVPTFIQLHQKAQQFYLGVMEGKGVRTRFQMVHLKRVNNQFNNLSGLLDVFKSKWACPSSYSHKTGVSICFTYALCSWDYSNLWFQSPPDVEKDPESVGNELGKIPFGTWFDPISGITISAIWPNYSEQILVDNVMHSDLEPIFAPIWKVNIKYTDKIPCLLGSHLLQFLALTEKKGTSEKLLGFRSGESESEPNVQITQALDRLTNPINPILNVSVPPVLIKSQVPTSAPVGPIPDNYLKEILFFLFPDALGKSCDTIYNVKECLNEKRYESARESLKLLKSVPVNSLTYLLSICICHVNYQYGGIAAVAHLWHEFILEMRHRWENDVVIPGLAQGVPDLSTSLLSQKLQMLNYCITKKHVRNQQVSKLKETGHKTDDGNSSSEDEFYDCDEHKQHSEILSKFKDSLSFQPEGRLRPCGNLKGINSDEILYIPITQDPPPMTEDQLEAHADVLLKLGTDEEGSQLRAKMQSACLLSDMQSFKAANPECQLEDFVRWYSPRDWIEGEEDGDGDDEEGKVKGRLSDRMLVPDNMWQTVWASAKPMPARRQRRLFDDTKEGEKVLHYLSSLTPYDLVQELIIVLFHAAVETLIANDDLNQPIVPFALNSVVKTVVKFPKLLPENVYQYKEVINQLITIETMLSQSKAFHALFKQASEKSKIKYSDISSFTKALFENQEAYISGGKRTQAGLVILQLLKDSQQSESDIQYGDASTSKSVFPSPIKKEYLLRAIVSRPASYSSPTLQRMYCSTSNDSFRLAGAFTQDTTFQ